MNTTILSQLDIQQIIAQVGLGRVMDELIARVEVAFEGFDPRRSIVPVRSGFEYSEPRPGLLEWMPLLESGKHVLIKTVGYHPQNPALSRIPTIISDFSLYDSTTGHLEAILDGTLLTALRTGAASAVASRVLGSPESRTIGLIGCGAQAVTQLHALSRVFDVDCVYYNDIDSQAIDSFEARCRPFTDATLIAAGVDEVLLRSDIVTTATSIDIGAGPVFLDQKTKSHLHVNAVGSDFRDKFELPWELLKRSFVTPDVREQADAEGECQQLSPEDIGAEFYQVLRNKQSHAELQQRTTVFDSTGWVLEDYVVTQLFLEYGQRLGIGSQIAMGAASTDSRNPYAFADAFPAARSLAGESLANGSLGKDKRIGDHLEFMIAAGEQQ